MPTLSKDGREQVALALILLRDFKRSGNLTEDFENAQEIIRLAGYLGVAEEFDALTPKIPPMEIRPR